MTTCDFDEYSNAMRRQLRRGKDDSLTFNF